MGISPHYSERVGPNRGCIRVVGNTWKGKTIHCSCDNAAVVAIVRSSTSKHQLVMQLMRCLFFFVAIYQVYLESVHLPRVRNEAADALSRTTFLVSCSSCVVASARSFFVHFLGVFLIGGRFDRISSSRRSIRRALIQSTPDWSSPAWTSVQRTTLRKN